LIERSSHGFDLTEKSDRGENDRRYIDKHFSFVSSAATGVGGAVQVAEQNQGQDDGQDGDDGDNEAQGAKAETGENAVAPSQAR
jgi:hypothetical protein